MNAYEATADVLAALEDAGIDYILVGSLATNFYGIPRSTKDADVAFDAAGAVVTRLIRSLGPPFRLDPQIGFESVTGTTRYLVDYEGFEFQMELFRLGDDPHDRERFDRRVREEVEPLGRPAWIPTPEDVVITKLRWAADARRHKDRDDVLNVLAVQAGRLDRPHIERWCARHGTLDLLREIEAELPDDL